MKWLNASTVSPSTSTASQNTREVDVNVDEYSFEESVENSEVAINGTLGEQIKCKF